MNPKQRLLNPLNIWVGYFWVPNGGLRAAASSRGCHVMSAARAALGKPDDAAELRALKWFRDHVMVRDPAGREELRAYYASAPDIVAAIERSPDPKAAYTEIYTAWIVPAVDAIERRDFAATRAIYDGAIRRLRERYLLG